MVTFLLFVSAVLYCAYSLDPTLGIWTSPPRMVPSGKEVDGPLIGNGDIGAVIGGNSSKLSFYIGKNDMWYFGKKNQLYGKTIIGLGGITFDIPTSSKSSSFGDNYQLEQHSDKGYITFNISSISGNATIHQLSNTLIINFNDNIGSSLKYNVFCQPTSSVANTSYANNNFACYRSTNSDVIFVTAAIAMNITLDKNTFILSVLSNFNINNNSSLKVVETAQNASNSLISDENSINQIWIDNDEWFNNFWNKSSLMIPNEELIMQFWYKSLYIQGISNRANTFAPGLWGVFVTEDKPSWNGDYTLNYNFEAPYYGIYSANHIEIATTYYEVILNYTKQGIIDAKYYYQCNNSVHYPGHLAPFGFNNSGDMGQHSDASFAALNFINHWRYTLDEEFITANNNQVYEWLRLVANWWICWLDRYENINNTGHEYIDKYDCTRENCYPAKKPNNTNPAISLSFIRFILNGIIDISNKIGINNNDIDKYKDILLNLSPIPIGEFMNNKVLLPQQQPYYFKPGDNPLQLYGIWPGEQIGIGSDENMMNIGQNTVEYVASWDQGNAYCEMYPSAVRVGYDINKTLDEWNKLLNSNMPQNGYVNMGGGGMDASGALIAVNELLLQSWNNNTIRLFPVYNFGNATFNNLRAVGAFLVSAEMINGVIQSPVIIISEKGENCKILSPWMNNIKACKMDGNQCKTQINITCDNQFVCVFATESLTTYQLYTQ